MRARDHMNMDARYWVASKNKTFPVPNGVVFEPKMEHYTEILRKYPIVSVHCTAKPKDIRHAGKVHCATLDDVVVACKNQTLDAVCKMYGHECDTISFNTLMTQYNIRGVMDMSANISYADEVLATLAELEESFSEKIMDDGSDPKSEVQSKADPLPPGKDWFSNRFGWTPAFGDFPISVYGDARPIDPNWSWEGLQEVAEDAMVGIENGQNIRFIGWPGTGKTVMAEIVACLTGRGFQRIIFENDLPLEVLVGCPEFREGQTGFKEGIGITALRSPNVICLDEVSAAGPNTYLGFLQPLLEAGRKILVKETGEMVHAHPGVVLWGADNSLGLGDNQDKFPTRNVQDISTLNRWNLTLKVDYMPPEVLAGILKHKYPKLHKNTARKIADFAALAQQGFKDGTIPLTFSPRQAFTLVEHAMRVGSIERAIRACFTNTLEPKDQEIVIAWMRTVW